MYPTCHFNTGTYQSLVNVNVLYFWYEWYSLLNKQKHCLRIFRQGALRQYGVELYTVALWLATETIKDRRVVHAVSLHILLLKLS